MKPFSSELFFISFHFISFDSRYEALFHGLEWKDLTESSPDAISAAPLYFSGFTHLTAMQQAVVDNFPLGQNLAREMIIFDLCRDAEAEGIRWMELSVPVQGEKESWVGLCESLDRAFHEYPDVGVGIVLCISRSSSPALNVLTVGFDMRVFPNITVKSKIGTSAVVMRTHEDTFYGSRVVRLVDASPGVLVELLGLSPGFNKTKHLEEMI